MVFFLKNCTSSRPVTGGLGCTGCVRTPPPPQAPKVHILILNVQATKGVQSVKLKVLVNL